MSFVLFESVSPCLTRIRSKDLAIICKSSVIIFECSLENGILHIP